MLSLTRPIAVFCLLLSGCALMMVGEPAAELDLTSQDDAQENLKAIRALQRAPSASNPPDTSSDPLPPNESGPGSIPHSTLHPVTPSSAASAANTRAPVKLPWTPPSVSRPDAPDRSVPAYTTPVGPNYSGSVRCIPDGMGGQRCMAR
jgi:hypothetical protein